MAALIENRTPYAVLVRQGARVPQSFSYKDLGRPMPWCTQVVVKATFVLHQGALYPSPQQMPVFELDQQNPGAFVENDVVFEKDGVDLVVLGEAVAPGGAAVRSMPVTLSVGQRVHTLLVSGDRRWRSTGSGWAPTDPEPFERMPLGFEQAFGGTYGEGEQQFPFSSNPVGKGWTPFMDGVEFAGRPLPNVEAPDRLVRSPQDEPDPAGFAFYRLTWALRLTRGVEEKADGTPRVLPRLWNCAHPDLVLERYPEGQPLRLEGMRPEGPLELVLPRLPVVLQCGSGPETRHLRARPDLVLLLPATGHLVVAARWLLGGEGQGPPPRELCLLPESVS